MGLVRSTKKVGKKRAARKVAVSKKSKRAGKAKAVVGYLVPRDARTGAFKVLEPAVTSKRVTIEQAMGAARALNEHVPPKGRK